MMSWLGAARARVIQVTSFASMYRLTVYALALIWLLALVLAAVGIIGYAPGEIIVATLAIAAGAFAGDIATHRYLKRPLRWESTTISVLIVALIMQPTLDAMHVLALAAAGIIVALSKLVLGARRHVFNPAAVAVAVMAITQLAPVAWWVGTPSLAVATIILGTLIAWRIEKLAVALVFIAISWGIGTIATTAAFSAAGLAVSADVITTQLFSSPVLFLGLFMLTEPLTLPPRRWQQFVVAAVAGALVGWPVQLGVITLTADRALLVANLVAFGFAIAHRRVGVTAVSSVRHITPTIVELEFGDRAQFTAGQYLELDVAHKHADSRGTRRELSIVSAPGEHLAVAYRSSPATGGSTYKQALSTMWAGSRAHITGIWGDFVLPRSGKIVLVAAGIGVTPFVSMVRSLRAAGATTERDIAVVLIASDPAELAYRDEFAGFAVTLITPADPGVAEHERWVAQRASAEALRRAVPDLAERTALISGPPALVAELSTAGAKRVKTDAFAGY